MKYRILTIFICLVCAFSTVSAQERIEKRYSVFFRVGSADVDRSYNGNGHTIETMINDIKATLEADGFAPDSLLIYASSSPEGSVALNELLAHKRANATKNYVLQHLPQLKDARIKVESRINDWSGVIQTLRSDNTISYREALLKILTDPRIENKEAVLRKTPEIYAVIRDGMFDKMRTATVTIRVIGKADEFTVDPELVLTSDSNLSFPAEGGTQTISYQKTTNDDVLPTVSCDADWIENITVAPDHIAVTAKANAVPQERTAPLAVQCYGKTQEVTLTQAGAEPVVEEVKPEPEPVPVVEPEPVVEPAAAEKKPYYIGVKTNMLYDLAIIPNVGVEFYLGKNFSVVGNWMYSWWKSDKKSWYWRTYGGDLGVRYWFGKAAKEKPLTGHHLGLYGQILTYDFEVGGRGYLGDRWTYGGGLEYGYSLPIARRLNIDFNLGVGYLGGEFKEYLPIDGHYVWQATKYRQWIGPTKAEISLVWLIGRGNENKGKGGKR